MLGYGLKQKQCFFWDLSGSVGTRRCYAGKGQTVDPEQRMQKGICVFGKGEYVVCGSKGVCTVEDITTLDMPGIDSSKEYYILKPVYSAGSTMYISVEDDTSLRRILTKEEADGLIREIPEIPLIEVPSDKMLEQEYKGCMRTNQCRQWVRILKTAYRRKKARQAMGRKITAVDAKYARIAEDSLYGELAIVLCLPREKIEDYIATEIERV